MEILLKLKFSIRLTIVLDAAIASALMTNAVVAKSQSTKNQTETSQSSIHSKSVLPSNAPNSLKRPTASQQVPVEPKNAPPPTPLKPPLKREQRLPPFFLELGAGLDLLGPVQFQKFSYSEERDQKKYDPNITSIGITSIFTWRQSKIGHSLLVRARTFNSLQSEIEKTKDLSSDKSISQYTIHALGYGLGYGLGIFHEKDRSWRPMINVFTEVSNVDVTEVRNQSSIADSASNRLQSKLILYYLELDSPWAISFQNFDMLVGMSMKFPFAYSKKSSYSSSQEPSKNDLDLESELNHRPNSGIGVRLGSGINF